MPILGVMVWPVMDSAGRPCVRCGKPLERGALAQGIPYTAHNPSAQHYDPPCFGPGWRVEPWPDDDGDGGGDGG